LAQHYRATGESLFRFQAINYADGKVYRLKAERRGKQTVTLNGRVIHCTTVKISLDSWLASLMPDVQLTFSDDASVIPFLAYSGPALSGGGNVTLKLLSGQQQGLLLAMR